MTVQPLPPSALRRRCDPAQFTFNTTADLDDLTEIVGQARAVAAVRFGIGIRQEGYNLYALGPQGAGKYTAIHQFLAQDADWLLLVTGGRLEMMAKSQNGSQSPIMGLGSGSFVSSQDLNTDGWAGSSIRASLDEPAEVLIVEGPDFQRWLKEMPAAQTNLHQAALDQRAGWSHQPLAEAV